MYVFGEVPLGKRRHFTCSQLTNTSKFVVIVIIVIAFTWTNLWSIISYNQWSDETTSLLIIFVNLLLDCCRIINFKCGQSKLLLKSAVLKTITLKYTELSLSVVGNHYTKHY